LDESNEIEGEYLEEWMGIEMASQICGIRGGFGFGGGGGEEAASGGSCGRIEKGERRRCRVGAGSCATHKWECGVFRAAPNALPRRLINNAQRQLRYVGQDLWYRPMGCGAARKGATRKVSAVK
jgi:hypothetical protein